MGGKQRLGPRKPATKFPQLRKKMSKARRPARLPPKAPKGKPPASRRSRLALASSGRAPGTASQAG